MNAAMRAWRENLESANWARLARTNLRWALKRGEVEIRGALDDPAAQGMALFDLLAFMPGRAKTGEGQVLSRADGQARAILDRAGIPSETVPVSALSPARRDQVAALAAEIAGRPHSAWPRALVAGLGTALCEEDRTAIDATFHFEHDDEEQAFTCTSLRIVIGGEDLELCAMKLRGFAAALRAGDSFDTALLSASMKAIVERQTGEPVDRRAQWEALREATRNLAEERGFDL